MYRYYAYGLTIAADVPLPELVEAPAGASADDDDVVIAQASLEPPPSDAVFEHRYVAHSENGTYFYWRDLGAFFVSEGCIIHYDLQPGSDEETFRLPLLGICLGTLLHARGLLTLHASAVSMEDQAVAFVGWKGTGKSTTAAALHARGHALLTDDVLALDVSEEGVFVRPAFPQLKLSTSALAAVGGDVQQTDAIAPHLPKRRLTQLAFEKRRLPLAGIYVLSENETLSCTRLAPRTAFLAVLSQTYAPRFVGTEGTGVDHFNQVQQLLQHVPVYLLERPRRLEELDAFAAFIEQHQSDSTDTRTIDDSAQPE